MKSRIYYTIAVCFIYGWSHEITSIKWCEQELKLSVNTIIEWNNSLREVCAIENKPQEKIGGPWKIVEIEGSLFSKKRKSFWKGTSRSVDIWRNLWGDISHF